MSLLLVYSLRNLHSTEFRKHLKPIMSRYVVRFADSILLLSKPSWGPFEIKVIAFGITVIIQRHEQHWNVTRLGRNIKSILSDCLVAKCQRTKSWTKDTRERNRDAEAGKKIPKQFCKLKRTGVKHTQLKQNKQQLLAMTNSKPDATYSCNKVIIGLTVNINNMAFDET